MDNQFVSEVTLTNFKKDGSSFRNFLQIFPLANESGTEKYFGGFLQEISDEKDVEKTHDIEEVKPYIWYKDEKVLVLLWGILLAFNSGYINGCCISGVLIRSGKRQGVSGLTGTYAKSGLFLADGNFTEFGFEIRMILSFIFGAFITGVLNPEAKPYQLGPSYGPTFIIGACCLIISSVLAVWDDENDNLFSVLQLQHSTRQQKLMPSLHAMIFFLFLFYICF